MVEEDIHTNTESGISFIPKQGMGIQTTLFSKEAVKGTHAVCFSISFHNVHQMPMSPRTNFHCKTIRVACSSG